MKLASKVLFDVCIILFGLVSTVECQFGNVFDNIQRKVASLRGFEYLEKEMPNNIMDAAKTYENFTSAVLLEALQSISLKLEVNRRFTTEACIDEIVFLIRNFHNYTALAWKFLDASGGLLPGISTLKFQDYGDFSLCRSLQSEVSMSGNGTKVIKGKYCMLRAYVQTEVQVVNGNIIGICVPSVCKKDDLEHILAYILQIFIPDTDAFKIYPDVECTEDEPLSVGAVLSVSLSVFLICLTVVATVVHIMVDRKKSKIQQGQGHANLVTSDVIEKVNEAACDSTAQSKPMKALLRFILCFSLKRNASKLFDMSVANKEGKMSCLNGIRVLTMSWIALAHSWLRALETGLNFKEFYGDFVNSDLAQVLINGTICTDTFLTLGGVVVTYGFLNKSLQNGGKINWPLFYIKRYFRLAPLTTIVVLLTGFTMKHWFSAPSTRTIALEFDICETTWWKNSLFINNLFKEQCMVWTWYLAMDFQLYAVSPLFLIPLSKKPKVGLVLILLAFLASTAYIGWAVYVCHFQPNPFSSVEPTDRDCDLWSEYFTVPWVRCNPYFVGMVTGYILFRTRKMIRISKFVSALGWAITITCMGLILFILKNRLNAKEGSKPMSDLENITYSILFRPVWAMCVAWVIFTCVTKNANPVDTILSFPIFAPLARVTFSFYLIHMSILSFVMLSQPAAVYYSHRICLITAAGVYLLTLVVAFPTSLFFETPFLNMVLDHI